jgi:hypothetical protein
MIKPSIWLKDRAKRLSMGGEVDEKVAGFGGLTVEKPRRPVERRLIN